MADETLYGCVETDGKITFTDLADETCALITNTCIEWAGVHAGQVAVTIGAPCDDTYYGCVNWTTGKFEVSIPDDCCDPLSETCPCSICETRGYGQPLYIDTHITGFGLPFGEDNCFPCHTDSHKINGNPDLVGVRLYHSGNCRYTSAVQYSDWTHTQWCYFDCEEDADNCIAATQTFDAWGIFASAAGDSVVLQFRKHVVQSCLVSGGCYYCYGLNCQDYPPAASDDSITGGAGWWDLGPELIIEAAAPDGKCFATGVAMTTDFTEFTRDCSYGYVDFSNGTISISASGESICT